ncbi:pilus assembly protein PilP [Crenobacter sp. SG2303]|uniref:Pilus assembly protein PilP n=1 Tax=Crenobacter oryzisoli TaxID=3056844 RepID=A0ABT7XM14_9NEIS|nr:pilus assembly protein PilP [Crenobacter sp. SG2303]MDN0074812.1 pilus assembly protein PilP [Crenobacter sp. SG2303]
MKRFATCLILLITGATLLGCGRQVEQELDDWMRRASRDLRGRVEPLADIHTEQPYRYRPDGLLSPFDPQKLLLAQRQANAPDFRRPREPLEHYELDKLQMVGGIRRSNEAYGLVRTPDGSVYRVQLGSYVGANFGRVQRIREDGIELIETVEDLNGDWVQRLATLRLDGPQEQKPQ